MDIRKAKANARRLKATVQRVEQQPYDFASGRRPPRFLLSLQEGTTSGTITARSGATPGSGSVVLDSLDASGNFAATSNTVTAYNFSATAINTGKHVFLLSWGGKLWVVTAEC
jgi:hypothetical protein